MGFSVTCDGDYEMAVTKARNFKKILAFGDSWLSNPGSASSESISKSMSEQFDVIVYCLTSAGKDSSESLSGKPVKNLLKKYESNAKNKNYAFSRVIVSAGRNDLIEKKELLKLLLDAGSVKKPNPNAADFINQDVLAAKISSIMKFYEEIITSLSSIDKEAKIVTHNYGLSTYSKKGHRMLGKVVGGSWIDNCFAEKKIDDENIRQDIVRHFFTLLGENFSALQNRYPGSFKAVKTQKLIEPDDWKDETHLKANGFQKIAGEIYNEGIAGW